MGGWGLVVPGAGVRGCEEYYEGLMVLLWRRGWQQRGLERHET